MEDDIANGTSSDTHCLRVLNEKDKSPFVEETPDQWFVGYSEYFKQATAPSIFQKINTRIVRRSAELLSYGCYCSMQKSQMNDDYQGSSMVNNNDVRAKFTFSESTLVPNHVIAYVGSTIGLFISFVLTDIGPISRLGSSLVAH